MRVRSDKYIRLAERIIRYNWMFFRERWWDLDTTPSDPISMCMLDDLFRSTNIPNLTYLSFSILAWLVMKKAQPQAEWYLYEATVDGNRSVYAISDINRHIVSMTSNREVTVSDPVPICSVRQVHIVLGEWEGDVPSNVVDVNEYIPIIAAIPNITHDDIGIADEMLEPDSDLLHLAKMIHSIPVGEEVLSIVLVYKESKALNILLDTYPHPTCVSLV